MPNYATGTGGVQAPDGNLGPVINTSDSTTGSLRRKKNKKRRVNGVVQYRWPNGTWHSRPFGKSHRSNAGGGGNTGGGGGGSTGGGTGGAQAPSKHPLLDRANALADVRYGGAEQSLTQRGLAIQPWYQNYMNEVTAAQKASQAYNAGIVQGAQQSAQQAGQVAPGLDPNTPAGQDAALAAAARQAMGNLLANTLAGTGKIQNDYLAGRQAVAATSELGARQQLASDKTALAKEKGAYVTETLGELRDKRRQQKLENAAFGLKASTESQKLNKYGYTTQEWNSFSDAKRNRIRNKQPKTQGPDMGKVNKYGYTEKQWRSFSVQKRQNIIKQFEEDGGKGDGPAQFTPAARHKTKADIRKGMATIKQSVSVPEYNPEGFWKKSYDYLVGKKGYDPLLARAIVQRMRTGRLNPALAKRLKKNYGITLGSGKKFKLPPKASDVPVVGDIIGMNPVLP